MPQSPPARRWLAFPLAAGRESGLHPDSWRGFSPAEPLVLFLVLAAAVAVRVHVLASFNLNWDEFYYLALVHAYLRGDLDLKLQSFHVHLFRWLPGVSGNEADQIVAARAVMLVLHLLTSVLLYRIARRLTSPAAALFATAAYLSLSFTIRTGASFRSDPAATVLLMAATDLLLAGPGSVRRAALAGLLAALAGMFTIKAAVYLPTLAVLLSAPLLIRDGIREAARRAAALALSAAAGFAVLYRLHGLTFDPGSARSSSEVVASVVSKTITSAGFLPQGRVLVTTLAWDFAFWALWLAGGGLLLRRLGSSSGEERARWVQAAGLALPVASLAVYRNSFPYYYPFILAPAAVLVAVAWQYLADRATRRTHRLPVIAVKVALGWFGASLLVHGLYVPRVMPLAHQRAVIAEVHRAFPEPVPYVDQSSTIGSFPHVGFFMTGLGLGSYLERGQPLLRQGIEARQPPLLLANHPLLDLGQVYYPALESPRLFPEDRAALDRAYIHHWGPIYVAGRRLAASEDSVPVRFELPVAGPYTLEAGAPVRIDGSPVQPGRWIHLERGPHWLAGPPSTGPVTLRWGKALYRPAHPPPSLPFFLGF